MSPLSPSLGAISLSNLLINIELNNVIFLRGDTKSGYLFLKTGYILHRSLIFFFKESIINPSIRFQYIKGLELGCNQEYNYI